MWKGKALGMEIKQVFETFDEVDAGGKKKANSQTSEEYGNSLAGLQAVVSQDGEGRAGQEWE